MHTPYRRARSRLLCVCSSIPHLAACHLRLRRAPLCAHVVLGVVLVMMTKLAHAHTHTHTHMTNTHNVIAHCKPRRVTSCLTPRVPAADVTLDMVPKLVDAEWKELIPQVGIRTALRKAAGDLHTESNNDLATEIESLRQQKAELQKEEDQQQVVADRYKEQIDLAKSRLKAKTQEMLDSQSQVSVHEHLRVSLCATSIAHDTLSLISPSPRTLRKLR